MVALLVGACIAWFALHEVYYDGSPFMPAFPALGGLFVLFLPMLTVYLARELLRGRRWAFAGAWLVSFAAFGLTTAIQILVEHYKPNCDRCHLEIEWDFIELMPIVLVYTGVVNGIDAVVARLQQEWEWSRMNRHPMLRLSARLVLTSAVSLLLMWILYELACSLRPR